MRCAVIPRTATLNRMSATRAAGGREPRCYELLVRGPIGPTMMQAFPTLAANRSGRDTLLTGSLPDQGALYGVIHQLEALGLELLEVRRPDCGGAGTTGQIA
jgi:hypothetical protein